MLTAEWRSALNSEPARAIPRSVQAPDKQSGGAAEGGMEVFLTAHQLAETLQVSPDWIYDQASSGGMPSYRIGTIRRFRVSEIEAWLQRYREPHSLGRTPALGAS
jgi:excisionase family DNA binding protein